MAPTKKSKSVKRYATVNEASPEKYGGGSNKKKQRVTPGFFSSFNLAYMKTFYSDDLMLCLFKFFA